MARKKKTETETETEKVESDIKGKLEKKGISKEDIELVISDSIKKALSKGKGLSGFISKIFDIILYAILGIFVFLMIVIFLSLKYS